MVSKCSAIILFGTLIAFLASSAAACPDVIRTASTAKITTTNDDGERSTTIWVTCSNGEVFIRTSQKSKWGAEVEQSPQIQLNVGDSRFDFVAEFVLLETERARVTESFREKYGTSDVVATWIRGRDPRIMRLKIVPVNEGSEIRVYTAREIVTLDQKQQSVEAVAVLGDRILAVGSLEEILAELKEKPVRVDRRFKDLVLVPGFINQHEHAWIAAIPFMTEVISIEGWSLGDRKIPFAKGAEEYRQRLKEAVAHHADPSEVFYTWGFHQLFHGELSRADLDRMSEKIPIVVLQRSLHEFILNTRALDLFGINQALIDEAPESVRAQANLGRGHFWEQGQAILIPTVFRDLYRPDRYLPALQSVEEYWHSAGSTLVSEPGGIVSPGLVAMQNEVLGDSETPFRMFYIADGKTIFREFPEEQVPSETEALFGSAKGMTSFLPLQIKLFADGAIFSQLMQMSRGYLDGHHGEWLMQPKDFAKAFQIYWDAGYQIHIHQNGDAGLDLILDTLEANLIRSPRKDHRTVIVHFGFARPDQVERIAELGAIVSANPYYPVALADRYSKVGIGPERAEQMVRLGDVARAGIRTSLHADMPMAPGRPLLLMSNAVNRITLDGNLVGPKQRISAEQALRAVTINAAHSLRMEESVGSIVPGKIANFTVLMNNPMRVPPETIQDIVVWGTVHEGRILPIRSTNKK